MQDYCSYKLSLARARVRDGEEAATATADTELWRNWGLIFGEKRGNERDRGK